MAWSMSDTDSITSKPEGFCEDLAQSRKDAKEEKTSDRINLGEKQDIEPRKARNGCFHALLSDFILILHSVYSVHSVVKMISTPAIPLIFLPEIFCLKSSLIRSPLLLGVFAALRETSPQRPSWSKIAHGISGLGQKPPKYSFSTEK